MQDPKKEIAGIVRTLCTTRDADELEDTVKKYYAQDAKFWHPLCKANSRNEILGLFQWYRLASPETEIKVSNVSECSSPGSRRAYWLMPVLCSVRLGPERSRL